MVIITISKRTVNQKGLLFFCLFKNSKEIKKKVLDKTFLECLNNIFHAIDCEI